MSREVLSTTTIKDIAKEAGVAASTVSYALNNDPRIPDETREKILSVAKSLGYSGKSGKKPASKSGTRRIILCLNTINGIIYSELVKAITEVLQPAGFEFFIYLGTNISGIRATDGVMILNSRIPNESVYELIRKKTPVVVMDRAENIEGSVSVTLDNEGGAYAVTKRAIEMNAESFCFICGPSTSFESNYRFNGFKKALSQHGITEFSQLPGDFTFESGRHAATYLINHKLPDAIICANDEMAAGVESVFRAADIPLPVLCGFDGIDNGLNQDFITAKASRPEWGHNAAYALLNIINGTPVSDSVITTQLVQFGAESPSEPSAK